MGIRLAGVVALAVATCVSTSTAQWPNRESPRVPRTADGTPNLTAPPPRTPDGRVDLSGVWEAMPDPGGKPGGIEGVVAPRYLQDVTRDAPARATLMLPWADALYKARAANDFLDNPQIRCLPAGVPRIYALTQPYKIVQTPDLVIMLYENGTLNARSFWMGADTRPIHSRHGWGIQSGAGKATRSSSRRLGSMTRRGSTEPDIRTASGCG